MNTRTGMYEEMRKKEQCQENNYSGKMLRVMELQWGSKKLFHIQDSTRAQESGVSVHKRVTHTVTILLSYPLKQALVVLLSIMRQYLKLFNHNSLITVSVLLQNLGVGQRAQFTSPCN